MSDLVMDLRVQGLGPKEGKMRRPGGQRVDADDVERGCSSD
jgi:hypothetical protein